MHVVHVYKSYAPTYGGMETYLQSLAEGQAECGITVTALVVNDGHRTVHELYNGIRVTRVGRLGGLSTAPWSPWLGGWLRTISASADLIHLHAPYIPLELGPLLLHRSKPFVVGYHADIVKQRVVARIHRPFLVQVLKRARLVSASTQSYVESSTVLKRFADKCRIIPYGVPLARFAPTPEVCAQAKRLREAHDSAPIVLFVGQMRHYKGLDVLLSAVRDIPRARLLVVGSGAMEEAWRSHARACALDGRVVFLGECPDAVLRAAYRAADVLVLPSTNRAEAFGMVLLEGMANGLPVISTELGTGTSVINTDGETGLVVPPGQPGLLAAAINRILSDDELKARMGRAALARVSALFSREQMLDRTASFYREALAQ
jgi:glycosyltransferase involved in cell wall biosynthesis